MNEVNRRILVVDDEHKILAAVKAYLERAGYEVYTAMDGHRAVELFRQISPDLLILDLMLPGLTGEEVCRQVRKQSRVPILMLTAKVQEQDTVHGFEIGADDYVTKPFSPRELVARAGSLLRRCADAAEPLYDTMSWDHGALTINFTSMDVTCQGGKVSLTPNEYKLLSALARYPKKVFTREELINSALGMEYEGFERTIDSHIKNLRGKIEPDTANPRYIMTVRGIGYQFGGDEECAGC